MNFTPSPSNDGQIEQGDHSTSKIEARTLEIGQKIFAASRKLSSGVFNKNYWQQRMMELSTSDPKVKTQLFRFVDVLPVLKTREQKKEHLIEYLQKPRTSKKWPILLSSVARFLRIPLANSWIVKIADDQVKQMGNLFIIGQTAEEVLPKVLKLRKQKVGFTLDILGEAVLSQKESLSYQKQYEILIDSLGEASKSWSSVDVLDRTPLGDIPKVNVSVKISAFDCLADSIAFEATLERLQKRIEPLLKRAKDKGIFVNFDMEHFSLKELTMELFRRIILKPEFRDYRHFGVVVQAYLKSADEDVDYWIRVAEERGTPFTIRLVKGAYWDYEIVIAKQNDWEPPVFEEKWRSDECFERSAEKLLRAYPKIELAAGSHNIRSLSYVMAVAEGLGLPKSAFEIQMLYGMSQAFKAAFLKEGMRIREYCPMGEMLPGLSYLVRRLLENTANDSFLKQNFMDHAGVSHLLRKPAPKTTRQ